MNSLKIFSKITILSVILSILVSCDPENVIGITQDTTNDNNNTQIETNEDYIWDTTSVSTITLNGSTITTTSSNVTINGTTATITAGGNYIVSGSLTSGQLVVDAKDQTVKIQLNGVTMNNTTTSPFYLKKATKVIVFLASGTTNTFTDATTYTNTTQPQACIFSNTYLAFTGDGTLNVTGKYTDGISSDDQIIINKGTFNVTAVDDGIRGKDFLQINNGNVTVSCTNGHALKSDDTDVGFGYVAIKAGTVNLASNSGKGVYAVNAYSQSAGTVSISSNNEGIESFNIMLSGGNLNVVAYDDGLNATAGTVSGGTESNDGSSINISGGTLICSASNGDAIDSNGTFTISGGVVVANGISTGVQEALDINGNLNVNGGLIITGGSNSNMTPNFSSTSTQRSVLIKSSAQLSAGSLLHIRTTTGTELVTFKPKNAVYYIHFSSASLQSGTSYEVYFGGSYTGGSFVGGNTSWGMYTGGTYFTTGATLKTTFTPSSSTTVNTVSF